MILDNAKLRGKLFAAFPDAFINRQYEFIAHPRQNTYFRLEDVPDELTLKCKVLEWLSREAAKSINKKSQIYHLNGINNFLDKSFTQDEMLEIYTYLGNSCNRKRTIKFIESGYDMTVLQEDAQ